MGDKRAEISSLRRRISAARRGRDPEVPSLCDQLLALAPDDIWTWNERGEALRRLKRYAEADASFAEGLEHVGSDDENRGLLLYQRGRALIRAGEPARALTLYPQSLALREDAAARYDHACALALVGRADEAIDQLDRAMRLDARYRRDARSDPDFRTLRGDPRFEVLVAGG